MITALLAEDFLQQPENKGATIVYDLRSSHVVPDAIKAAGGVPRRDRVGHAFIKKTMAETKAVFGGELSGHFYFRDNFFADSAAVAFARVLSVVSAQDKPLERADRSSTTTYSQSGEINFQVEDKDGKIRELADALQEGADRLPRRHHDRLRRLVVQRPQEQHRAAAAAEPRSGDRRRSCRRSWRS